MVAAMFFNSETLDTPLGMDISTTRFRSGKIAETPNELSDFENARCFEVGFTDYVAPCWPPVSRCTRITLQASQLYELY